MKMLINAFMTIAITAMVTGCMGGAMVRKDLIEQTNRIAIVSVVVPRIADTAKESNRATLQAAADRALLQVETGLKTIRSWTVVNSAGYKGSPSVVSFTIISEDELEGFLPKGAEAKSARDTITRALSQWKVDFVGAKGLPVVPRAGLVPNDRDKSALSRIPPLMQQHAARLCSSLNVDAVAFVHVLAGVTHPRPKTFIVSNNRTDGALRAAQTMVIVDKTGRIIADLGWPALDERARTRDLLPLYIGSGQDAVKPENIDLGDPRNKIMQAFSALMDETAADMITALKKAVVK